MMSREQPEKYYYIPILTPSLLYFVHRSLKYVVEEQKMEYSVTVMIKSVQWF